MNDQNKKQDFPSGRSVGLDLANKSDRTFAKCNVCGQPFQVKLRELETKETISRWFNCPYCMQKYHVYTKHKKKTRRNSKGN